MKLSHSWTALSVLISLVVGLVPIVFASVDPSRALEQTSLSSLLRGRRRRQLNNEQPTVAEIVQATELLSTLWSVAERLDLVEAYLANKETAITLLAPTDAAFAALASDMGEDGYNLLLNDEAWSLHLGNLVKYHLTGTAVQTEKMVDNQRLVMLNGEEVTVNPLDQQASGNIFPFALLDSQDDQAVIIMEDIVASNGVVHITDAVLQPKWMSCSLLECLTGQNADDYSMLKSLLIQADLDSLLDASASPESYWTLLAPDNDAFAALGNQQLEIWQDRPQQLKWLLMQHILQDVIPSDLIADNEETSATTRNRATLTLKKVNKEIIVDDYARVTLGDVLAKNGIVHGIDKVLTTMRLDSTSISSSFTLAPDQDVPEVGSRVVTRTGGGGSSAGGGNAARRREGRPGQPARSPRGEIFQDGGGITFRESSQRESVSPSVPPSAAPSAQPSASPSAAPTNQPSSSPSAAPSNQPSSSPSATPTTTTMPSMMPTSAPSNEPTLSALPSVAPSARPSSAPTSSIMPSQAPSVQPSFEPSSSARPSASPSAVPSARPSSVPSAVPSVKPSAEPTVSELPSLQPSATPSRSPSSHPSMSPSEGPTTVPLRQNQVQQDFPETDGICPPAFDCAPVRRNPNAATATEREPPRRVLVCNLQTNTELCVKADRSQNFRYQCGCCDTQKSFVPNSCPVRDAVNGISCCS